MLAPLPLVFPSFVGAAALLAGFASWRARSRRSCSSRSVMDSLPDVRGFRGAWFVLTLFTYPYVYLPVAARMASTAAIARGVGSATRSRSVDGVFGTVVSCPR